MRSSDLNESWKVAKLLVALNPMIASRCKWADIGLLKKEVEQDSLKAASTVLMISNRNTNQFSRLDNFAKGELVKYVVGRDLGK